MVTIHNVVQGSPEWHALRLIHPYTGSNADKLFKFGKITYSKNTESTFTGNYYTRRGHTLEDEAIDLYERAFEVKLLRVGFVTNDKYPECGYSPDALSSDTVFEVKAFNSDRHEAMRKYTEFKVKAQIEYGKCICELKKAKLLLYNPDLDAKDALIVVDIPYNSSIQANLRKILKES